MDSKQYAFFKIEDSELLKNQKVKTRVYNCVYSDENNIITAFDPRGKYITQTLYTVLNYDSTHVQAYLSRGSAYSKLKKYDLAMNDFNKVLKFDASNYEAYNNRGFVKKAQGDFEGACKDWNYSKKMGNQEAIIILKNNHCR
jgi:tetratricopeptide (TPR) repeat protein